MSDALIELFSNKTIYDKEHFKETLVNELKQLDFDDAIVTLIDVLVKTGCLIQVFPFMNCPSNYEGKYIVRLYDGFDNEWMDISKEISREEALKLWLEKTKNGTEKIKFSDIDYFAIFPANIKMHYSTE